MEILPEPIWVDPAYAEAVSRMRRPSDRWNLDAYRWLLHFGHVHGHHGRDVFAHLHLLSCGLDPAASDPVEAGTVSSFSDTYSEPDVTPMVVGRVSCRCGTVRSAELVHDPLPLGELFSQVAAFATTSVPSVPVPSGVVPGALVSVEAGFGRAFFSVEPGDRLRLEIRRQGAPVQVEVLDWDVLVHVLGLPVLAAAPGAWRR